MSEKICISLRAHGTAKLTDEALFNHFGINEDPLSNQPNKTPMPSAMIDFCRLDTDELNQDHPLEYFVLKELDKIGVWLNQYNPETYDDWRKNGMKLELLLSIWTEGSQFDLNFPHGFLLACGKAKLPLLIFGND